jgi:hypothetical protein
MMTQNNIMNNKGQTQFMGLLFSFVMGLILLIAFIPMINEFVTIGVASNMDALSFSNIIILLLGMSGIIVVLLFFQSIFQEANKPQAY